MKDLHTCPNCGCNLRDARRSFDEKVQEIVDKEYGELLKKPRRRARILGGLGGLLMGVIVSVLLTMMIGVIFSSNTPIDQTNLQVLAEIKDLLMFNFLPNGYFYKVSALVLFCVLPIALSWIFAADATSRKERWLRRKTEERLTEELKS